MLYTCQSSSRDGLSAAWRSLVRLGEPRYRLSLDGAAAEMPVVLSPDNVEGPERPSPGELVQTTHAGVDDLPDVLVPK